MKILFASMPADGHFNPLTGVAAHLAGAGHDVRWYAGPEYGPKLDGLGMTHFPYRRATEITAGNLNERFPERARLKGPKAISFDLEKFFVTNVDNHFQDIVGPPGRVPVRRVRLRRSDVRREAGRRGARRARVRGRRSAW